MRFLIAAIALLVSACGFTPLYKQTDTIAGGTSVLQNVWIETIPNASGNELRNNLIDRFYHHGYPDQTNYSLIITLQETARDIVIEKEDITSRTQLVIVATYAIKDRMSNAVIETGKMRGVSSYNVLISQYTTMVTQNEARRQVLSELADKITMRTAVVLRDR